MHDRFNFKFWLGWILWFAGSLVLAAMGWTALLTALFGSVQGVELTLTWAVSVFGTWFLVVIPFMRKKEQIWKRMNQDQEKAVDAWLQAMGIFIGLLIITGAGWSLVFRDKISNPSKQGIDPQWAKAVFSSWLFLLLPFLVWMYKKSDQIFKAAVKRQTAQGPQFNTVFVDKTKRLLPRPLAARLQAVKPLLENGHIVTLTLKGGAQIPDVFVINSSEILGIYNRTAFDFDLEDVVNVVPVENELPAYEESKWLRLDGRA